MKSSIHRLTLDMHKSQSQISIPVLRGDTSRELHIILSDGGNPYVIENGCLAKISIKRPTGTELVDFCAIKDNTTIVYDFKQNANTAAVEGIHDCDISIYGLDGAVITSARFTMVVYERAIPSESGTISDEDKTTVDAVVAQEAVRQADENARKAAEKDRNNAEVERNNAEVTRQETFDHTIEKVDNTLKETTEKINNALKVTFSDDNRGNVSVSMIGLHLVDKGEGNIVMEVHE